MNDLVTWFSEPLEFAFVQRAMLVAIVVGITCAVLSCWLTLLGWSLLGDGVSHSVLPGIVLSYVLGAPLAIGAFIFGAGAVALIGGVSRTSKVKEDASIGIVFTGLFALGLVLVSVFPSELDLQHILVGNVLGVSDADIITTLVIGVAVTSALLLKRRDLVLYAFDSTHAHAIGISPRRLEILLLGSMALTVIAALQAVGIVLVVAMLITPAATGYLLTDRFDKMLAIAVASSVFSCVLGTYLSYHVNTATGGAIVVVLTLQFVLAYLWARWRGRSRTLPGDRDESAVAAAA